MTQTKLARLAVALFLLALTLIGLFTCKDYGVPCDEISEQEILKENLHEYAWHLLGPDSAAVRYYQEEKIGRIFQSIEKDHGQSAYYPMAFLLAALANRPDQLTLWWHVVTWLWFMAGVCALYGLCRETGLTRPVSCMGTLLLYLCPRFFAEGHYNNKDMVLLALVLLTLWLGARFLRKTTVWNGLLFSLAGALAANTKIVGLFFWGMMGLAAVVLVSCRKKWSLPMVGVAAGTIASFAVFYTLLTPALWTNPWEFLTYLLQNASGFTRWNGVVLFRGSIFTAPMPWYYLPWMMILTLPVYVLPLAAVGQLAAAGRICRQKGGALQNPQSLTLMAATLGWLVPMAYQMLAKTLIYNGWRHFYFVYAGVALMGAQGMGFIIRILRRRTGEFAMHRLFVAGMCLLFLWMSIGIAQNHPYQYGYYNRIERAGAEDRMELDYWGVHTLNLLSDLAANPDRNQSLPLEVGARDDMSYHGLVISCPALNPEIQMTCFYNRDAPYLYLNTTYARIYGVAPPEGYHELQKVKSYGLVLGVIYERDTNE